MEVRINPTSPRAKGKVSARFSIDQGELRSILSNLSHELCRPLVSLRAGFDLLLDDSPSTISSDQRGHLVTMVSLCDELCASRRVSRLRGDCSGLAADLPGLIHDWGPDF